MTTLALWLGFRPLQMVTLNAQFHWLRIRP